MRVSSLPIIFALGLAACSGGGGGSSSTTTPTPADPTPVNAVPTVASANSDQTANVGFELSYDATQNGGSFSDSNNDTLSYTISFAPDAMGLTETDGVISGTPDQTGTISVTIAADDGNGGSVSDSFDIDITAAQDAVQTKFGGVIDLDNLENYANKTVADYIDKLDDGGNPITDAGATLGRVLFFDTALSSNDTVSCASCHAQVNGFSDLDVTSTGLAGGQTGRHSMRLINTMFADERQFFWDERAESHEAQESQPIHDEVEMGFSGINGQPNFSEVFTKLEAIDYYQELFRFVYHDENVTEERIQDTIAQFVKSIQSFDSKFDTGRSQVNNNNTDFPNFTADENAGKTLFIEGPNDGGAGCQGCHRAPEFDIRPGSDHNGVVGVAGDSNATDFTVTRAPTLRDVVDPNGDPNGPFMHDGSLATLRDVIDHYNAIQVPTTQPERADFLNGLDNRLDGGPGNNGQRLNLTDAQKDQLEAFMMTLTGTSIYTDTKLSDPF